MRAGRGAIGVVALLLLMLQGLVSPATIGHIAGAHQDIRCAPDASSDEGPAGQDDCGSCCATACKTCACGHLAILDEPEGSRQRPFISIHWVGEDARRLASPRSSHRHARDPPAFS